MASSPVVGLPIDPKLVEASDSVWDRISNWASENKAVVYTIAGVTLVATGAGVYFYLSSDQPKKPKKKSKNKKKAKKDDANQDNAAGSTRDVVSPSADALNPEDYTEEFIEALPEQVR
jgi:import receptor subunit TOM70